MYDIVYVEWIYRVWRSQLRAAPLVRFRKRRPSVRLTDDVAKSMFRDSRILSNNFVLFGDVWRKLHFSSPSFFSSTTIISDGTRNAAILELRDFAFPLGTDVKTESFASRLKGEQGDCAADDYIYSGNRRIKTSRRIYSAIVIDRRRKNRVWMGPSVHGPIFYLIPIARRTLDTYLIAVWIYRSANLFPQFPNSFPVRSILLLAISFNWLRNSN